MIKLFSMVALTWAWRKRDRGVSQRHHGDEQWKGRDTEKGGSPGVRCTLQHKTRVIRE